MQVKIFETSGEQDPKALNEFLAQDGKTILVDRLHTAGARGQYTERHWVTVEYRNLEQAPPQL
jgi:hypothetical protein